MRGDNSPGSLHSYLHQKRAHGQRTQLVSKSPQRDHTQRKERRTDQASPTSDALRELSEGDRSQQGSQVIDDRDVRHRRGREAMDRFQKVGIEVLRSMREKMHATHHANHVHEQFPIHCRRFDNGSEARHAMLLPGFRLRHFEANVESQQSGQASRPEHGPPSPHRQDHFCRHRREQISAGISGLHDPRNSAAPFRRHTFHRQRCADTPLSSHADAVDRPENQEHRVVGREPAEQLHYREENNIEHQGSAATVAIGEHAEQQRSQGTHRQSEAGGEDDF